MKIKCNFKIDAHAACAAPAEGENVPRVWGGAIFKIDAYDERFLTSSVVTCGVEILSAYIIKFSR